MKTPNAPSYQARLHPKLGQDLSRSQLDKRSGRPGVWGSPIEHPIRHWGAAAPLHRRQAFAGSPAPRFRQCYFLGAFG